jgi:GntR family transcriptional repressor for pyruvate dehydrogenase complex
VEEAFVPVARRSVAADAAEQIKELILRGVLEPGDRLPVERELAAQLGVSRPTLREAIRALVSMGVLEPRQGSGTYVTDLAPATLAEPLVFAMRRNGRFLPALLDVRIMLEVGAVEQAATRIDADGVAELRRLNELVGSTRHDPEASIDHDTEFHRGIYAAAGNPILTALLDSLQHLGRRTRGLTIVRDEVNERVVGQHAAIVDAIEAGDETGAAQAMVEHLRYVRETLTAAAEDFAT